MRYFRLIQDMNLRKGMNGAVLATIPKGTVLETNSIQKASNGTEWANVTYNGITGKVAVLPESKGYSVEITKEEEVKPVEEVVKVIKARDKMVAQMQSWIGKKEADGTHKMIIDIYNNHTPLPQGYKVKYTDSWCATTVSAAAISCGFDSIFPIECSCGRMIALAQKMGIWQENDDYIPQPGDIILYDWDDSGKGDDTGWPEHVGCVEKVSGNEFVVIEGNLNDAVGRRTMQVNGKFIRGFVVPKYETKDIIEKQPVKPAPTIPVTKPVNEGTVTYYPKYTGKSSSIVDALVNVGEKADLATRKKIAEVNGITNYTGTTQQNMRMLSLLKAGKLIKIASDKKEETKKEYYPKYTGNTVSIVVALNAVGVDSSFANRVKIAKANGITVYVGTASQNIKLLNLLKEGKLIKAK